MVGQAVIESYAYSNKGPAIPQSKTHATTTIHGNEEINHFIRVIVKSIGMFGMILTAYCATLVDSSRYVVPSAEQCILLEHSHSAYRFVSQCEVEIA